MKILILAPHPDDEVLGCGGTIAKNVGLGHEIYVVIITKAYTPNWSEQFLINRQQEIKAVKTILGIKEYIFLDYPTVKVDTFPQKDLCDKLTDIVNTIKPEILYIPHKGDLNKDHRLTFEAALVAARPINHKIRRILSYEVLSETEWGNHIEPFFPTVYVDISDTIELKIKAILAYKSELKEAPHPRSIVIIRSLAQKRGSEVGVNYAEAFTLLREISDS